MDPSVLQQLNAGWGIAAQRVSNNAEHDGRALGAAIWASMIQSNDPASFALQNTAARTPTTLEHPPYPGYSYPAQQSPAK